MKHILIAIALTAALIMPAAAEENKPIPQFHWTYHSLGTLSEKGLISEDIVPGKSTLTTQKAVSLLASAVRQAENKTELVGETELASMRQLAKAYRNYFADAGLSYEAIRSDIEKTAARAGLTISASGGSADTPDKKLSAEAAESINKFTFDIYKKTADKLGHRNFFISPYSISTALAMTYAGALGDTEREMASVLSYTKDIHKSMAALISDVNSVPKDIAEIRTANALWPDKDLKITSNFEQTIRNFYKAGLSPLNYAKPEAARNTINNWTAKETNNKIKNLIAPGVLTKDTLLVLTNAVYFKSSWEEEFQAADTAPRPFWVTPKDSTKVLTMERTGDAIGYLKLSDAEIAELPYKGGRFSMVIMLPDSTSSVETLENNLNAERFAEWVREIKPRRVKISLPKFKQENDYELAGTLSKMGMSSAFNAAYADFGGITGRRNIFLSNVVHKTFIDVAEEGTEAAAATAVIMMRMSLQNEDDTVVFRADRPFIYLIKDNSAGVILFIGRCTLPRH